MDDIHIIVRDMADAANAFPFSTVTFHEGDHGSPIALVDDYAFKAQGNNWKGKTEIAEANAAVEKIRSDHSVLTLVSDGSAFFMDTSLKSVFDRVSVAKNTGQITVDLTDVSGKSAYRSKADKINPALPANRTPAT